MKFAQGIKAGRWVFATGVMAQDFKNGIAPDVLAEDAPHASLPKREKEALRIWKTSTRFCARPAPTATTSFAPTSTTRRLRPCLLTSTSGANSLRAGSRHRPPSRSRVCCLPGADMNIQALGIIPGPGFEIAHVKDERLSSRPTAGFSAALTVGDFIFVPGLTSSAKGDEPHRNGVAKAALLADGQQWAGQPIKVETEFLIRQRIMPSLALAGATIDDIIHAQVYLTDPEDYSAFNETWSRHFAKTRPSLSIIPIAPHGLASYDGTIEINVLAAKPGSAAQKRHVDAGVPTAFRHQPQAVKAGDLLFMSAQMAIDSDGRLIAAAKDARQARFGSRAQVQAEHIIDNIEKLCRAAGTSMHNIVRVLQFHTDLDEFYPVYQVWERRLGGRPLPFSAVEVPAPLPTPGATLMIEAWAYVP